MATSNCTRCGKAYERQRSTAVYCGSTCRTAASRERKAARDAVDTAAVQQPPAEPTPAGAAPGTGAGQLEQRFNAVLQAQGWSEELLTYAGLLGLMVLDMARFQEQMQPGQNKAANNRELRLTLAEFRAQSASAGGSAVDDDEEPDQPAGGQPVAPDPDPAEGGDVVPFGRRSPAAG